MADKSIIDWIALVLVVIGGLNWGLAVFRVNLVELIFRLPILVNVVYGLVGISALWVIYYLSKQ